VSDESRKCDVAVPLDLLSQDRWLLVIGYWLSWDVFAKQSFLFTAVSSLATDGASSRDLQTSRNYQYIDLAMCTSVQFHMDMC